jgi:predicted transcriptional regulator
MARPTQDVTDAELAVLRALWDRGPATIRSLTEQIYPGGGASRYATVQKLLERLEAKGCVRRERGDGANVFEAAIGRDDLIGRRLRDMAAKLCGGSLTPLLTHLVESGPLTDEDRRTLRALVDRLDRESKSRRRGGRA